MTENIGRTFIEGTYYQQLGPSDQMRGLPQPPLQLSPDPDAPRVVLPPPGQVQAADVSVRQAIEDRRSVRKYADTPLTLGELSGLLWWTQGVRDLRPGVATFRTVPSAGARHAFETYLLVNRVDGVEAGLYRYLAVEHQLQRVSDDAEMPAKLTTACFEQKMVSDSAVTFIWTAVVYRMAWRYGQRGYRYLLLDAGHVCQNLYLAAEAVNAGVCAIAAFEDRAVNRLLGIDGRKHLTVYLATVGKKSAASK